MDPNALKLHLEQVCQDLDRNRPLRRPAFARTAALALVASLGTACGEKEETGVVDLYAAPIEDCANDADDDGDDAVDCADTDCYEDPACAQAEYAAPFE